MSVLIACGLAPGEVQASPHQVQAESLNDKGKAQIKLLDLAGAAQFFRLALVLDPDPRYSFNLCYTLDKSGRFEEAKEACQTAIQGDNRRVRDKAQHLLLAIEEKLAKTVAPKSIRKAAPSTPAPKPTPQLVGSPATKTSPQTPSSPSSATAAPLMFGASFGISYASASGSDSSPTIGYAFGASALYPLSPSLGIVVDLQYVQRSRTTDSSELLSSLRSNYLDLSPTLRFQIGSTGTTYYAEAGVTGSLLLAASNDDPLLDSNSVDLAWTIGAGYQIHMPRVGVTEVRARYVAGLLEQEGPTPMQAPIYNRTILLQSGYWF